jgi:hypothetical protein
MAGDTFGRTGSRNFTTEGTEDPEAVVKNPDAIAGTHRGGRHWVGALAFALGLSLLPSAAFAQKPGDLRVLAINGGGDRTENFASHLAHLRQLVDVLAAAGIPADHVTVLASDGNVPAPDLATREPDPETAWLLQGTHVDPLLRDLTNYESSALPGVDLRPATVASLTRAVNELRTRLRPGDTLLVYVTDHGTQSRRDPTGNRITLWGPHESISVSRLGALLARLPPAVRVVSLMSQCYSGGFAYMHEAREHSRIPNGSTCGYFSSTPDRPAYGCYPEVRGQKAIGHSFEFLSALASGGGNFPAAHAAILASDDTPDIPLRSSDVYLAEVLGRQVVDRKGEAAFVDGLLAAAYASGIPAKEKALLDRIATLYGLARPTSIVELDAQVDALFGFLDVLDAHARIWEAALGDFNQANLDAFLSSRPAWRERLQHRALQGLAADARRARVLGLLSELFAFVTADAARMARANRLVTGLQTADELGYRTEIRVAALLRIRFLLTTLAGGEWVKKHDGEARAALALSRCEDLSLPLPAAPPRTAAKTEPPKLPTLAEDQRRAATLRPGWLGITFVPVSPGRRERLHLPGGAATITSVLPRSPAAEAGLRQGDIVTGTPGQAFAHASELRPFIASASPGESLGLEVLRGGSRVVIKLVVREAPVARTKNR